MGASMGSDYRASRAPGGTPWVLRPQNSGDEKRSTGITPFKPGDLQPQIRERRPDSSPSGRPERRRTPRRLQDEEVVPVDGGLGAALPEEARDDVELEAAHAPHVLR